MNLPYNTDASYMLPFIKLLRNSNEFYELLKARHTAFCLLCLIAFRARRTTDRCLVDLEIGEALIGDFKAYGVTEQIYRTDKKFLEKHNFITTRVTSRGTIAKLIDKTIFDINEHHTNDQLNSQLTTKQRPANDQLTTNKNVKNVKNVKKLDLNEITREVVDYWNRTKKTNIKGLSTYKSNLDYWLKEGYTVEDIKRAIDNIEVALHWAKDPPPSLTLLLRRTDKGRNPVDRIGEVLNYKGKHKLEEAIHL